MTPIPVRLTDGREGVVIGFTDGKAVFLFRDELELVRLSQLIVIDLPPEWFGLHPWPKS